MDADAKRRAIYMKAEKKLGNLQKANDEILRRTKTGDARDAVKALTGSNLEKFRNNMNQILVISGALRRFDGRILTEHSTIMITDGGPGRILWTHARDPIPRNFAII